MVYIAKWAEYQVAAEALYERAPERTRYCVKWKPSEGKLVLKITDDTTCLKYKTHSSIFLNRFEALNLALMQKMTNVRARASIAPAPAAAAAAAVRGGGEKSPERAGTPVPVGVVAPVTAGGGVHGGGGVKKKKGKKKK